MSNEEALQILSEHDRIGVNIINANDAETTKYNNDSVEALSMAIAALKAQPCCESMDFPDTFEEFVKSYGIKDSKEVYTNGSVLIPVFRVKQWLDHDNKLRTIETDTAYECGKHAKMSERLYKIRAEQFAKWVATEIFDDMWGYNKDAFAEIACRKLAKLGIVRAEGDEWVLVEPQESEGESEKV